MYLAKRYAEMPRVNSGHQPMRNKSNTFHTDLRSAMQFILILACECLFNIQYLLSPAMGWPSFHVVYPPLTQDAGLGSSPRDLIKDNRWMDGIFVQGSMF